MTKKEKAMLSDELNRLIEQYNETWEDERAITQEASRRIGELRKNRDAIYSEYKGIKRRLR